MKKRFIVTLFIQTATGEIYDFTEMLFMTSEEKIGFVNTLDRIGIRYHVDAMP